MAVGGSFAFSSVIYQAQQSATDTMLDLATSTGGASGSYSSSWTGTQYSIGTYNQRTATGLGSYSGTARGTFASHQTNAPSPSTTIPVGAQGRYVRVQLTGTNYLSLAEVQIYGQ